MRVPISINLLITDISDEHEIGSTNVLVVEADHRWLGVTVEERFEAVVLILDPIVCSVYGSTAHIEKAV